jgi:hypothetical protein
VSKAFYLHLKTIKAHYVDVSRGQEKEGQKKKEEQLRRGVRNSRKMWVCDLLLHHSCVQCFGWFSFLQNVYRVMQSLAAHLCLKLPSWRPWGVHVLVQTNLMMALTPFSSLRLHHIYHSKITPR